MYFLKRRRETLETEREQIEKKCLALLREQSFWQTAETVYLYCSYGEELATTRIMQAAKKEGKRTVVPKVISKGNMDFYEIFSLTDCEPGTWGILEPRITPESRPELSTKNALMLLPGLAFGKDGSRLGYGGGFYDRYLNRYPDLCKVGLCYPWALQDTVPSEETDVFMDWILTPDALLKIK